MRKTDFIAISLSLLAVILAIVGTVYLLHTPSGQDKYQECRDAGGIPVAGNAWVWGKNNQTMPVCLHPSALIGSRDVR